MQPRFTRLSNFFDRHRSLSENLVLALWIVCALITTLNHELWRDEVRSLNLAMGIHSFPEFIEMAKYDGHPILWRSVLTLFYEILPNPAILQVSSLIIGFASVWLLVKYSPLPLWIKGLFIFGVVSFMTNTVMARDYGITTLLFFVFAILISQPQKRPLITGVILFLAANTNSYGMYMSGLFLGFWILDSGFDVFKDVRYIMAVLLVIAGILFSQWSTRVDVDTVFMTPEFMAGIDHGKYLLNAVLHPGEYIYYMLNIDQPYRDIFMVLLILGVMVVNPWLGLAVLSGVVIFNYVGGAIIYPKLRHQGVLLGFIMTSYWIAKAILQNKKDLSYHRARSTVYHAVLIVIFVPFMIHNVGHTKHAFIEESSVDKSSALALGRYIEANAQLQQCIIIGEPDYALQTIAYYSDNPLYLAREKKFAPYVKYSKAYQTPFSLSELLETAKDLKKTHNVPIMIVLGFFGISEEQSQTRNVYYRGTFDMSGEDVRSFKEQTLKLAEFNNSLGDEDYQLFLYTEKEELERYRAKYMNLR